MILFLSAMASAGTPTIGCGLVPYTLRDRLEPRVAKALGWAVEQLTPAECARLYTVRIRRRPRPLEPRHVSASHQLLPNGQAFIEIYDAGLATPRSTLRRILLHEIAHAIAFAPKRRRLRTVLRQQADQQRIGFRIEESSADGPSAQLECWLGWYDTYSRRIAESADEVRQSTTSEAAARYARAFPAGYTSSYSRTSDEEMFAEAFAYAHAMPRALDRLVPTARGWFVDGKHLVTLEARQDAVEPSCAGASGP